MSEHRIDKETAKRLNNEWLNCPPGQFCDLFCTKSPTTQKLMRLDTYSLKSSAIEGIKSYFKEHDVKNNDAYVIRVSMGKGKIKHHWEWESAPLDDEVFIPILEIRFLDTSIHPIFFKLKPETEVFALPQYPKLTSYYESQGEISATVGELFILNWQALYPGQLTDAFECISPSGVSSININKDGNPETYFRSRTLHRVKYYYFEPGESEKIIDKLFNNEGEISPSFYIHMGSGLIVPDYHPFNFRPIINVTTYSQTNSNRGQITVAINSNYFYDTSKPCPPFCDDGSSLIQGINE